MVKKIMLVDDHPVFTYGLAQVINFQDNLEVCAQFDNAGNAIQSIDRVKPDLIVVDITLDGRSGIDLIHEIKQTWQYMLILVVSMHDESLYANRAFRAGARGFVQKDKPPSVIVQAINQLLVGGQFWSEFNPDEKQTDSSNENKIKKIEYLLTDREYEVFELIAQGYRPKQISEKMCLSINTIETHRSNIKRKLEIKSSSDLSLYAVDWNKLRTSV